MGLLTKEEYVAIAEGLDPPTTALCRWRVSTGAIGQDLYKREPGHRRGFGRDRRL